MRIDTRKPNTVTPGKQAVNLRSPSQNQNGSRSSGCAISRRACFFMPALRPGERRPSPEVHMVGLWLPWSPAAAAAAADGETVRYGTAHAENVPGGKPSVI